MYEFHIKIDMKRQSLIIILQKVHAIHLGYIEKCKRIKLFLYSAWFPYSLYKFLKLFTPLVSKFLDRYARII